MAKTKRTRKTRARNANSLQAAGSSTPILSTAREQGNERGKNCDHVQDSMTGYENLSAFLTFRSFEQAQGPILAAGWLLYTAQYCGWR